VARESWFARRFKSPDHARRLSEESLQFLNTIQVADATAFPLNTLGCLARDAGDYAEAKRLIGEALEIYRANEDQWGIGFMLYGIGDAAHRNGDYDEAQRYFEESIAVCDRIGDQNGVAWAYNGLGNVARRKGQFAQARQYFEESLTVARRMGFQAGILTNTLLALGWLEWLYLGEFDKAKERVDAAQKILRMYGSTADIAHAAVLMGHITATLNDFTSAKSYLKEGLQLASQANITPTVLSAIVGLSGLRNSNSPKDKQRSAAQLLFARQHPALNPELFDVVDTYLDNWQKELAPRLYAEATEQAATLHLDDITRYLLKS
jgi:tetratricopeptide (TPR) repeat protein